jgi:RNA polymerase sigma-70 factor (ECF subfamily)
VNFRFGNRIYINDAVPNRRVWSEREMSQELKIPPNLSEGPPMERVATIETAVAVDREEEKQRRFVCLMNGIRTELYNFAFRLTGTREEAEDLLQESYFKAFKYFHQLREEAKFKEWIFQITANQFKNFLRRKKKENTFYHDDQERVFAEPEKVHRNPDELYLQNDRTDIVRKALELVSPKMRSVLVLFEIEGYSIEEVSDTLRISRGTVKSRLHYARKKLREVLETGELAGKMHLG